MSGGSNSVKNVRNKAGSERGIVVDVDQINVSTNSQDTPPNTEGDAETISAVPSRVTEINR